MSQGRGCRFVIGVPSRIAEPASLRCPVGLGERVHGRDPLAGLPLAVQDPLLDLFGYLGVAVQRSEGSPLLVRPLRQGGLAGPEHDRPSVRHQVLVRQQPVGQPRHHGEHLVFLHRRHDSSSADAREPPGAPARRIGAPGRERGTSI
jgi:hypothetical protein